jgi:hypothetical protein
MTGILSEKMKLLRALFQTDFSREIRGFEVVGHFGETKFAEF